MKKSFLPIVIALFSFLFVQTVSAHVVVTPDEVGIGAWESFSVGVPVEKDLPTTSLRLVIPDGLQYVTPNTKPGWKIQVKKSSDQEDAKVTEIVWTGGTVPSGQRDDFVFSAKAPSSESVLIWKAYQTYSDGTIVSWDAEPSTGSEESEESGPYSQTKVIDDLKPKEIMPASQNSNFVSFAALAISTLALFISATSRRKKH